MAQSERFDPCTMSIDPQGRKWRVEGEKFYAVGNEKISINLNLEARVQKVSINYTGDYALVKTENRIVFIKNLKEKPELLLEFDDSYYELEYLLDICWSPISHSMVILINKSGNISTFDVEEKDFGEECTVSYPTAITTGSPNSQWGMFCAAVSNKTKQIVIVSPLVFRDTKIPNYQELAESVPQVQRPLLSKYFSEDDQVKTIASKFAPAVFPIEHTFNTLIKSMQWIQNKLFVLTEGGEIFKLEIRPIYPFESSEHLKANIEKICDVIDGQYLINIQNNLFVWKEKLIPILSTKAVNTNMSIEGKIELLNIRKASIDERERKLEMRKHQISEQLAALKKDNMVQEKIQIKKLQEKFEKLPSIPLPLTERDVEILQKLKEMNQELLAIRAHPKLR